MRLSMNQLYFSHSCRGPDECHVNNMTFILIIEILERPIDGIHEHGYNQTMIENIQKLIQMKYRVLPLAKGKKVPLISQWTTKASYDEGTVQAWMESFPGCNWGLATGRGSGVIVIDIDPRHGGDAQWKRLTAGKSVITTTCKTGGGGWHYYFQCPNELVANASLKDYPGIDIRGENGQVVIPPSMHGSGNAYAWERAPWDVPPAPVPDWLLRIINVTTEEQIMGETMAAGNRNNSMFHQALMLARQGALEEFTVATMKVWRTTSNAKDIKDDEIEKTVESAYKRAEQEKTVRTTHALQRTDSDNADRMVRLYENQVRYATGYGWVIWDDRAWVPDEENARVITLATESMLTLRDEALEEAKTPENFKAALAKSQWAMNSLNIGRLHATTELASARAAIRLDVSDLDGPRTRHLLNVRNGVIDLKDGSIVPHDSQLMMTKVVDVDYDPSAVCPFWEHTLELAFDGNKNLIDYMKRAIGYSITGSVSEQCLFICWGEQGNNGKSTILEMLQWLLKPYAAMSDMKVITSQEMDNRVSSSLAQLPGVRMVSMNEANENQKLSESLIKQITGGDSLQACKKFHEPFEFSPIFKLWIRTNEKPIIRGVSDAIWRRIKLIPFIKPIPAKFRRSRDEVDDALHEEAEGILNWCVQGAMEWYAGGLKDPEEVTTVTAGYRSEMDVVSLFFDECVIADKRGSTVSRSELYRVFARWARENGMWFIMQSMAFEKRVGIKLNQLGTSRRVRGQLVWEEIELSEFAKNSLIS